MILDHCWQFITNDGDQYLKKLKSNFFYSAMCQILMDGWELVTLAWRYGCSCSGWQ